MDRDEPNPYIDLRLGEIHDAMMDRAGDLLEGRPVKRRDIAYLLIAGAWQVAPHEPTPKKRASRVAEGETVVEVYGSYYADQLKALRYTVLKQAADGAGLCERDSPQHAEVGRLMVRGIESDAAFTETLATFDRLRTRPEQASMIGNGAKREAGSESPAFR